MTNNELANLLEHLVYGYSQTFYDGCCDTFVLEGKHTDDCPVPRALAAAKELRERDARPAPLPEHGPAYPPDEYLDTYERTVGDG